jgi:Zn-dependent protease with chaperone function
MDRATWNFLVLAAIALVVGAYGLCALVAYGIVPLLEGRGGGGLAFIALTALATLVVVSAFRAARTLRREVAAAQALSRRIGAGAIPAPERLRIAANETGIEGRVVLIDSASACSFVFGIRSPRVVLSTGLLSRLSAEELRAALEHERYHVLCLDPLRGTVARVVVEALFFLPALRTLNRRYETGRELAADRRAAATVGRRPLAGALLKAMEGVAGEEPAAVALAAPAVIDSRLAQLETGREPRPRRIDAFSLVATGLGALAFAALLVGVPLAIGGGTDLSRELGPASILEGVAFCLLPLTFVTALGYRRLSIRSADKPHPRGRAF